MRSTPFRKRCWTSLLVRSSVTHPMSTKPALQGFGSVPGESAQSKWEVKIMPMPGGLDAVQLPWKRRGHVERAGVCAAAETEVGAERARGRRQGSGVSRKEFQR